VAVRILLLIALIVAVPAVALAADEPPKRLPEGARIAGVDVGGLGPIGAERAVRAALAPVYGAPITVRVGSRDRALDPEDAGMSIGYDAMVDRAFELLRRNRRTIDVPLALSVDGGELTGAVRSVGRRWYRAARNARVRFGIRRVRRIRHRFGRRLDAERLRPALLAEFRVPTEGRVVKAGLRRVRPRVTTSRLGRVHHTFVSVDRRTFTLRLFKRLRVVRTYRVAVGAASFDTPAGLHHVQEKQVDPAWHAPNRPWAGSYAGQTIPSGDPRNPLKARWIGLGGGVGIHGTAEEWSIGSRASHGCIRMRVRDVKRLYPKVPLGTPVLIR
jgi:hypothetical protein